MRQEDKEVDGPALEQAEERRRENELVKEDRDELYDLDGRPQTTVDMQHQEIVIEAMQEILDGEQIVINDLDLSKRQLVALEALKTAKDGKDQKLSQFVYAEDRRALLEQSLAVLQPEITAIDQRSKPFQDLLKEVGALREELGKRESLERSALELRRKPRAKAEDADHDEDDKPEDAGTAEPATDQPSTLSGPERKAEPKPASSLTGPERKPEPRPKTTLGDPAEIEAAHRRGSGD